MPHPWRKRAAPADARARSILDDAPPRGVDFGVFPNNNTALKQFSFVVESAENFFTDRRKEGQRSHIFSKGRQSERWEEGESGVRLNIISRVGLRTTDASMGSARRLIRRAIYGISRVGFRDDPSLRLRN